MTPRARAEEVDKWFTRLMRLPLSQHGHDEALCSNNSPVYRLAEEITAEVQRAVAEEREACALIAETAIWPSAAIRARQSTGGKE
jgi:hypothetical protein